MSIRTVENPVDGQIVTIAEGIIDAVRFRDVEADKYGNNVSVGVRIGDDWINLKIKGKEGYDPSLRVNAGTRSDPDWQEVVAGDEVKINVNPSEYNGKTYYYSGVSKIHLIKKDAGQATKKRTESYQKSASGGSYKKDDTPIIAGNARTAATTFASRIETENSLEDLVEFFARVSHNARAALASEHKEMSSFEVGVTVGQATVAAAQMVGDLDDVADFIENYVSNLVPFSLDVVKRISEPEEKKAPAKKVASKKSAKKPVAKKQEVEEESSFDDNPFADEDDDSAPF